MLAGSLVPEHLKEEYRSIKDELTKRQYQPPEWEPETDLKGMMWIDNRIRWMDARCSYAKMFHTTKTMKKQTASQLAERILSLALQWKGWLDHQT